MIDKKRRKIRSKRMKLFSLVIFIHHLKSRQRDQNDKRIFVYEVLFFRSMLREKLDDKFEKKVKQKQFRILVIDRFYNLLL